MPIAISAYSGDQLELEGALDITDIGDTTPNVTIEASRATNSTLTAFIRGVGQQDPVGGFEAGVGIYLDDVYLNRPQAALLDIYDVERIEVLRGPQGTLYGAGAVGGLLKYVTRSPDLFGEEARVGFGLRSVQDGGHAWNARFGASLPLKEDRLGLRMSFARNGIAGFTDNAVDGREDINKGEQIGARTALSWDGETFDLGLSVLHQRIRSDDRAGVADEDERLDRAFSALADPVRRAIIARLSRGSATVSELAAPFAITVQGVSQHIAVLEQAGLVTRSRDAQRRPVHLDPAALERVTAWIDRYRLRAEASYRRLDQVLDELREQR